MSMPHFGANPTSPTRAKVPRRMDTANPAWQALQAQNSLHAISTLREAPDGEGTKGPVPAVKSPWNTHGKPIENHLQSGNPARLLTVQAANPPQLFGNWFQAVLAEAGWLNQPATSTF